MAAEEVQVCGLKVWHVRVEPAKTVLEPLDGGLFDPRQLVWLLVEGKPNFCEGMPDGWVVRGQDLLYAVRVFIRYVLVIFEVGKTMLEIEHERLAQFVSNLAIGEQGYQWGFCKTWTQSWKRVMTFDL